jgi:hypothetical protein
LIPLRCGIAADNSADAGIESSLRNCLFDLLAHLISKPQSFYDAYAGDEKYHRR